MEKIQQFLISWKVGVFDIAQKYTQNISTIEDDKRLLQDQRTDRKMRIDGRDMRLSAKEWKEERNVERGDKKKEKGREETGGECCTTWDK